MKREPLEVQTFKAGPELIRILAKLVTRMRQTKSEVIRIAIRAMYERQ